MALIQILIIGWISDLLARIAVAFARWNFLLFLSLKTKKIVGKSVSYTRMLQMNLSTMLAGFFLAKNSEVEEIHRDFLLHKGNLDELSPLLLKTRSLIQEMRQLIVKGNEPALECTSVIQKDWLKAQWFTKK